MPTGAVDVKALAAMQTPVDRAVANGSSIAILIEHRGASVVLGADTFAMVMAPALQSLAAKRKQSPPMKVDAIKLSHHGSRGNVTNDLLDTVQADHYLFSTNNAIFNHPDDESVARVLSSPPFNSHHTNLTIQATGLVGGPTHPMVMPSQLAPAPRPERRSSSPARLQRTRTD